MMGTFGNWNAITYKEGATDTCYVASYPKKEEGHQSKPGHANILVTHWRRQKTFGIVSVTSGYDYQKNSTVELVVDGEKFSLFTNGSRGWAMAGGDAEIVEALKIGRQAVVTGTSAEGARTRDVYSLEGFREAYTRASKACGLTP